MYYFFGLFSFLKEISFRNDDKENRRLWTSEKKNTKSVHCPKKKSEEFILNIDVVK